MMELYSFGYKDKLQSHFIERLKEIGIYAVLDTRFNPNCFNVFWKGKTLENQLPLHGIEYYHEKNLGNSRYFEKGTIQIANLEKGIESFKRIFHDEKVCLLCTCVNFETCHNKIIVENLEKIDNCKYIGRL